MKPLIFVLLLFSTVAYSQKNTIYFSTSIPDWGIGGRFERQIRTSPLGYYVGATKGQYYFWYDRHLEHLKIVSGITYYVHTREPYTNMFCIGLNYNRYSYLPEIKDYVYSPVSFDIGAGIQYKHISFIMAYDILKKDALLNLGWRFGKR